jgi:hypothetical protein
LLVGTLRGLCDAVGDALRVERGLHGLDHVGLGHGDRR